MKAAAPPDPTWTTVLLHAQRRPHFGAWCHRCGALDVATVGTMRALSPTARRVAVLVWAATGLWYAFARRHDGFDVSFDGVNMRYAFLDEWRAVGFARANGGVFGGPPRPERDEYEPDRQTGDHGRLDLDDAD